MTAHKIHALEPDISAKIEALHLNYRQFMLSVIARKKIDLNGQLNDLVSDLKQLTEKYADFLFCVILLDNSNFYSTRHPILSAIVCNMMASQFELNDDEAFALVASALTANAGMFKVMDSLAEQQGPLSDAQRQLVQDHPRFSVELLVEAEIRNPLILESVFKHHEKLDGSGYPQGLKDGEITRLSSLLSLTDVFCAMLLPRKYRDGIYDKKAIQHVFQQRSEKINPDLVDGFIKEVGIYPPGVFVELKNKEEAIVAARNPSNASRPLVVSFAISDSGSLDQPEVRDTEEDEFNIEQSLPPIELPFTINKVYEVLAGYTKPEAADQDQAVGAN